MRASTKKVGLRPTSANFEYRNRMNTFVQTRPLSFSVWLCTNLLKSNSIPLLLLCLPLNNGFNELSTKCFYWQSVMEVTHQITYPGYDKIMTYILTVSRHVRQIHHLFAKLTERFDKVSKSGALFNRVQTCSHLSKVNSTSLHLQAYTHMYMGMSNTCSLNGNKTPSPIQFTPVQFAPCNFPYKTLPRYDCYHI